MIRKPISTPARVQEDTSFTQLLDWIQFYFAMFQITPEISYEERQIIKSELETKQDLILIDARISISDIFEAYKKYVKNIQIPNEKICDITPITHSYCGLIKKTTRTNPNNLRMSECLILGLKYIHEHNRLPYTSTNIVCGGSYFVSTRLNPVIGIYVDTLVIDTVDILDDNNMECYSINEL